MQAAAASSHKALIGSPRLSAIPPMAKAGPAAGANPDSLRIPPPSFECASCADYRTEGWPESRAGDVHFGHGQASSAVGAVTTPATDGSPAPHARIPAPIATS